MLNRRAVPQLPEIVVPDDLKYSAPSIFDAEDPLTTLAAPAVIAGSWKTRMPSSGPLVGALSSEITGVSIVTGP